MYFGNPWLLNIALISLSPKSSISRSTIGCLLVGPAKSPLRSTVTTFHPYASNTVASVAVPQKNSYMTGEELEESGLWFRFLLTLPVGGIATGRTKSEVLTPSSVRIWLRLQKLVLTQSACVSRTPPTLETSFAVAKTESRMLGCTA